MKVCLICKRPIGVPGDPLSLDCGGDCLGCVRELGDDIQDPRPAMPVQTQQEFDWRLRFRPENYAELPSTEQRVIDRKLGLLDWKA